MRGILYTGIEFGTRGSRLKVASQRVVRAEFAFSICWRLAPLPSSIPFSLLTRLLCSSLRLDAVSVPSLPLARRSTDPAVAGTSGHHLSFTTRPLPHDDMALQPSMLGKRIRGNTPADIQQVKRPLTALVGPTSTKPSLGNTPAKRVAAGPPVMQRTLSQKENQAVQPIVAPEQDDVFMATPSEDKPSAGAYSQFPSSLSLQNRS